MRAYCETTQQAYVRPVMFVVAEKIDEAARIRDMLVGPDLLGDPDQVLLVTSDQPDEVLGQLDALEDNTSKVRAVVSVSMLKEGWDVKNIYVIAAVRALESDLLTEQILGRGLRLPFGKRTGVGMLDAVEVISHHSFRDLLRDAEALLMQTLGQRAVEAAAAGVTTPGVADEQVTPANATAAAEDGAQEVLFSLPGAAPAEVDPATTPADMRWAQESLVEVEGQDHGSHQVGGIGTVQARLASAAATTETLNAVVLPRQHPGVALPLFIPRVTFRMVRDPFSLAQVSVLDVEALGRKFSSDNAPTLTRKAIEAYRDAEGVHIDIKDRSDDAAVLASQTCMPVETIEGDLVGRLMASNAVAATTTEMNAATHIARAFLLGAQVTEQTPWRPEHGRLASTALVEWIGGKQTASPRRQVTEITQVKWPDPPEIHNGTPPADRHKITRSADFIVGYPYKGWTRGLYDTCSFDAYTTEFRLAELLDNSGSSIRAWVRLTRNVPLAIAYLSGAGTRTYYPDFIVIDEPGTFWIVEGKRDNEMRDDVVLAKRDAAAGWVKTVNTSGDVQDTWGYLLASEAVIKDATSWTSLRAGAQTFR
jgi:type III restriction enzyme